MSSVILLCGRLCSGKTTYAKRLCRERSAVLLSIDEIMLALFGQHCGDMHDTYAERTKQYLLKKSVELYESGIDIVLDWGFWTRTSREEAKAFFRERGIPCEMHYIDIDDATWRSRLAVRNAAVAGDATLAYYVDENLAAKFAARFEMPQEGEIDRFVRE